MLFRYLSFNRRLTQLHSEQSGGISRSVEMTIITDYFDQKCVVILVTVSADMHVCIYKSKILDLFTFTHLILSEVAI